MMKLAALNTIPTPALPLKGRENARSSLAVWLIGRGALGLPLKRRENARSSPFKGEVGRGMGLYFTLTTLKNHQIDKLDSRLRGNDDTCH
jgi:hypothetical protein